VFGPHRLLTAQRLLLEGDKPIRLGSRAFDSLAARGFGLAMAIASPDIVEVAVHCGPHACYIRGHRARTGHWIKGRCVRTRQR
jgi:hypothetical protein